MSNTDNYYLMSIEQWKVVVDGTLEECIDYVELAIADGSKDTFIRTCGQIPIVSDCAQIRRDRFTKAQKDAEHQRERARVEKEQNVTLAKEPKDII